MSEMILDCEALSAEDRTALESALSGAFESDLPLVLELLFVPKEEIRALNARARGVDAVTDVLSFPAAELVPGAPVLSSEHGDCVEPVLEERDGSPVETGRRMYLGSVVICTDRAREQAEEYGHSYEREVCYLTVHGMLHCLGYDHETEEQKRVMRAREGEIMAGLGLRREE